jgi:hypothetical protein
VAFGGVQQTVTEGAPDRGRFLNLVVIRGLTLAFPVGLPLTLADPGVGELTTAAPGVNQNGLPTTFGRGRGGWRPGDENSILVLPSVLIDPDITFACVCVGLTRPGEPKVRVVNGDLVLTFCQDPAGGTGGPVILQIRFLHTAFQ